MASQIPAASGKRRFAAWAFGIFFALMGAGVPCSVVPSGIAALAGRSRDVATDLKKITTKDHAAISFMGANLSGRHCILNCDAAHGGLGEY